MGTAAAMVVLWVALAGGKTHADRQSGLEKKLFAEEVGRNVGRAVQSQILPVLTENIRLSIGEQVLERQVKTILPVYGMADAKWGADKGSLDETGKASEDLDFRVTEDDGHSRLVTFEEIEGTQRYGGLQEGAVWLEETTRQAAFLPHEQQLQVNPQDYSAYEDLVREFYTIDANTMAGSDQLNINDLTSVDLGISKDVEGPQILIYHTHSREAFSDSVQGDPATSIVGVGEALAQILREEYGYEVLHCTEAFDAESRDDAYGRALPAIEEILAQNPSIQVVIDLHRDEMPADHRLAVDLDGRPTARFMFFNGLSRTKKTGNIAYLKNDNLAGNLAFSFQLQLKCVEYYPGLARKIYLKGYRYNMHLRERSLLVELGAQNNTVEEAMNACGPLAHVLDMVLSGE